MATKTPKQIKNINDVILSTFMDYVLTEGKSPDSVYLFTKHAGITEDEFYKAFASFNEIDETIWQQVAENTINSLMASKEFETYNSREKLLAFFYTLTEALSKNRSYYIFSLKTQRPLHKNMRKFKEQIENFAKPVIQQGLVDKELEERKFISDRYHDAVWLNTIFILNFWINDSSKAFEKTDAAIEKSVNLMLELMGKSALDSMMDLGKFLFQNITKK